MFSKILVPLDGTAESNIALPPARALARATGAPITLLRVVPRPYTLAERTAFDETAQALNRVAAELASGGVEVEALVQGGDVVDEILQACREQAADLVVMRTHGRAGVSRAVLGSVTQRVVAECGVPVMLLRPGGRRITHLRKLLVPIDGSPGGAVALGTAVGLVKAAGATMHLLEVAVQISASVYAGEIYGGMGYIDPAWDADILERARAYVEAMVKRLRISGFAVDGEARQATNVADTIVGVAAEVESDLIVMSTQALTGPARALLGSVADAVVRRAHCPVLLVHRDAAAPAARPAAPEESGQVAPEVAATAG
ncbi:MAG TPA: universal stress protein [Chloroflexota bacterium]|nr:universal stress protein [Chloroflexota bacterium]